VVAPAETARRLQQALGPDSALLDGVDVASLPPSLEVALAPGTRDVLEMSPTMHALRAAPGVSDIAIEDGGTDHTTGALVAVRSGAWIAAALFGVLALVSVLAALRIRLERGRRERKTLQLLGASPAFTIVPTALAGAWHGAAAAAAAVLALAALVAGYGDAIACAFGAGDVLGPAPAELALFVVVGGLLGLVGGGLAGAARA
jgi:cell division protein FtsX